MAKDKAADKPATPRKRIVASRSKTAEIIARIEAERARGKDRQVVLTTRAVASPMRRTAPKPPSGPSKGRTAAAKAAAAADAEKAEKAAEAAAAEAAAAEAKAAESTPETSAPSATANEAGETKPASSDKA